MSASLGRRIRFFTRPSHPSISPSDRHLSAREFSRANSGNNEHLHLHDLHDNRNFVIDAADRSMEAVETYSWYKTGSSPDSAELFEEKSRLRKTLNERINRLSPEEIRQQSDAVTCKVLQHCKYQQAECVSIYLSFDKEIQTDKIVQDIFSQGKECYVPQYFKGKPMEMVRILSFEDYQNLPRNKWNIKQPPRDDERENVFETGKLDLILMPGLGFTSSGKRLGRGKGYYDEFLVRCASLLDSTPYTIALAFSEQIVKDIPMADRDVYINEVISP